MKIYAAEEKKKIARILKLSRIGQLYLVFSNKHATYTFHLRLKCQRGRGGGRDCSPNIFF